MMGEFFNVVDDTAHITLLGYRKVHHIDFLSVREYTGSFGDKRVLIKKDMTNTLPHHLTLTLGLTRTPKPKKIQALDLMFSLDRNEKTTYLPVKIIMEMPEPYSLNPSVKLWCKYRKT